MTEALLAPYGVILLFGVIVSALGGFLLIVAKILGSRCRHDETQKKTDLPEIHLKKDEIEGRGERYKAAQRAPYECGYVPREGVRIPLHIPYYVVALLFVLFDVELVFLAPYAAAHRALDLWAFGIASAFLLVLTVGFIYEWRCGVLHWQTARVDKNLERRKSENPLVRY